MASRFSVWRGKSATLSTTTPDTIYFSKATPAKLYVVNRDASNVLYFTEYPRNEVQTITLSAGAENDTFKLTFETVESSAAVTIPAGGYANVTAAQIRTCLNTITGISSGDVTVTKNNNDYAVTFVGAVTPTLGGADVGAITITSKTGAANGSVAETTKGGAVSAGDDHYAVSVNNNLTVPLTGYGIVSVVGSGGGYSVAVM